MAEKKSDQDRLAQALKHHDKAVEGNKKAVNEAYIRFNKLRMTHYSNPLIEAYYGSTLTLMGRDMPDTLEKMYRTKQGLAALDRAVAWDPHSSMIRIMRGKVCTQLPEDVFHRTQLAIDDFMTVLNALQITPGLITQQQHILILQDLIVAYRKLGNEIAANEAKIQLDLLRK
ncbi:MAG: hypothetical protein P0Y55_01970 [Candidatus Cohnella colombiensis]|uniref:Uncharacterized protein n=1 Tax=Candidatus Cohnella colombiensis TaxID=3121368 RepID=A0AA95EWQ4_9BACL|nr:MAG: hypothetical protein P0Y55_01970 [Cohnella sp.]